MKYKRKEIIKILESIVDEIQDNYDYVFSEYKIDPDGCIDIINQRIKELKKPCLWDKE